MLAFSFWLAAIEMNFSTDRVSRVLVPGHFVLHFFGEGGEERSGVDGEALTSLPNSRMSAAEM